MEAEDANGNISEEIIEVLRRYGMTSIQRC